MPGVACIKVKRPILYKDRPFTEIKKRGLKLTFKITCNLTHFVDALKHGGPHIVGFLC